MSPTNIWIALLKNSECFSHLQFFHPRKKGIQQFSFRGIFAPWADHRYWYFHFYVYGLCVQSCLKQWKHYLQACLTLCRASLIALERKSRFQASLLLLCLSFPFSLGNKACIFSHLFWAGVSDSAAKNTQKKVYLCLPFPFLFPFESDRYHIFSELKARRLS